MSESVMLFGDLMRCLYVCLGFHDCVCVCVCVCITSPITLPHFPPPIKLWEYIYVSHIQQI